MRTENATARAIRYSKPDMNCPNCGLTNPDNAKFCANCGMRFANLSDPHQTSYQTQSPQEWPRTAPGKNSVIKNIGLGCLVVLLIFLFFGLSCTRACFRHRRYYRHYGAVMCPAAPRDTSLTLCAPTAKPFPIAGNSSVFRENIATPPNVLRDVVADEGQASAALLEICSDQLAEG
jgi:hypothetical protein